jgi:ribokinase
MCSEAKVPVVMDVGGRDTPFPKEILPYLDVLSPNETELSRITGMPTETTEQVVAAANTLIEVGVNRVLVKLGSRGSMMVNHDGTIIEQSALMVDKVIDTTGAGDSFTAAYTVAVGQGKSVQDSMLFASAAAAVAIQMIGAMPR